MTRLKTVASETKFSAAKRSKFATKTLATQAMTSRLPIEFLPPFCH